MHTALYLHALAYIYTYINDNVFVVIAATAYDELESFYVLLCCASERQCTSLFVSPPGEYYSNLAYNQFVTDSNLAYVKLAIVQDIQHYVCSEHIRKPV